MIILFTLVIVVIIDYVSSKVRENSHDTRTASVRKEISSEIKGTQTRMIKHWLIAIVVLAIIVWDLQVCLL